MRVAKNIAVVALLVGSAGVLYADETMLVLPDFELCFLSLY